jgi:hypothetical protein
MVNIKIADGLYLLNKPVGVNAPPVETDIPTDHVLVIDCSGSMLDQLSQIRQQLKNKLAMMLKETDTVSIIWFSGRNQYGVVVEGVPLRTAVDLSGVHRAIDTYLKPVGLTGFVEPLEEVAKVIGRVNKPGRAVNLFFMSDGHDNQWSKEKILAAAANLQSLVSSAAVVEYGWYCNHPLMVQMAEKLGANQVLAEHFSQYEPIFETAMTKKMAGVKKIEIDLGQVVHGFAFAIHGGEILSFSVENRKVLVPEGLETIHWFAELPPLANFYTAAEIHKPKFRDVAETLTPLYASLVPLTQRMLSNDLFRILKGIGDVRLIREFTNCFGKQAYVDFQNKVTECVFSETARYINGYNPNEVPAEDAYTVLDLLHELSSDNENLFYPNHPSFSYKRTGRKAVQVDGNVNEAKLANIANQLKSTRNPTDLSRLQQELAEVVGDTKGIVFTPDNEQAGYPVSSLVLNENRPNISAQVSIPGTVDLSAALNEAQEMSGTLIPEKFPTRIVRNYTIIRDGIRNVNVLPVSLTKKTHKVLKAQNILDQKWKEGEIYEIDLAALPLINRMMVTEVSAKDLFTQQYELLKAKAAQKVFNYYYNENFPTRASEDSREQYGPEAATWLYELGIRDYGFSPKVELVEPTESYYGKELAVSIKGMASLPSVSEALDKLDGKKPPTGRVALLVPAIQEVKNFLESPAYQRVTDLAKGHLLHVWLSDRQKDTVSQVREAMRQIAQIKFSIIVGQTWFKEFSSLDENSLTMKLDGVDILCTANLKEISINV